MVDMDVGWWGSGGFAGLQGGEFWMALEPCIPAGDERLALALSGEDAMQVAAGDSQLLGCE
jgi:hypothetical protein